MSRQADPPAPPAQPPDGGAPDPEAARVQALDTRFSKIETEQREQRGILDRVLAAVTGPGNSGTGSGASGAGDAGGSNSGAAAGLSPAHIAQQVRDEIAAADQRRATQEADKQWRDEVQQTVDRVKTEFAPREPETGVRARVQRLLLGKPD